MTTQPASSRLVAPSPADDATTGAATSTEGTAGPHPCCRFCEATLTHTFVDLGRSPLANSYLNEKQRHEMEPFYPLHAYVCANCFLVQLEESVSPARIFSDYAYFASYSESWLKHAEDCVDLVTERFGIDSSSQVIEVASNDGYLLQYFLEKQIPVYGIEPAANVAEAAEAKGIPTLVRFFGSALARELVARSRQADLLLANNVLAHVPALNDFVAGLRILLKPRGVIAAEFPHLLRLMQDNQFDTIYHEHFSYFSLLTIERIFARHGLRIFDVQELTTHGGSLRIFACREEDRARPLESSVEELKRVERDAGLDSLEGYAGFGERVRETRRRLLKLLIDLKQDGHTVAAYGAAAKGNTLLNYCGIRSDFLEFVADRNPHKQGLYLPGTHIPIVAPEAIEDRKPEFVLILPWNLTDEVCASLSGIRQWGGRFIVPIPEPRVLP